MSRTVLPVWDLFRKKSAKGAMFETYMSYIHLNHVAFLARSLRECIPPPRPKIQILLMGPMIIYTFKNSWAQTMIQITNKLMFLVPLSIISMIFHPNSSIKFERQKINLLDR